MKILYGVQATGNGHITRARTMARAFQDSTLEVDYLFSGRARKALFDMEAFGDYQYRSGMTFATRNGELQYVKTAFKNNVFRFVKDVLTLDLSQYDLVITDFEPVTAWAAKLQKKPVLGIGHQYAFKYDVPSAGSNFASRMVIKHFAPAERSVGVHWHHYNSAILPPLIEPPKHKLCNDLDKVLVYLPFEALDDVVEWLMPIDAPQFYVYHDVKESRSVGNIHIRPFSRDEFQYDLATCSGVVCSAGFGLVSESIQCGKKLLVKPVKGQMEQLSNAKALQELAIGEIMCDFSRNKLEEWIDTTESTPQRYPEVAKAIVQWIERGFDVDAKTLAKEVWAGMDHIYEPDKARAPATPCKRRQYGVLGTF